MKKRVIKSLLSLVSIFLLPVILHAQPGGVTFWNKMESSNGPQLLSEVGPNLNLTSTNWNIAPAMFGDGLDNSSESSYAYANSTDLIDNIREGAFTFWWVPDDDGDTFLHVLFGNFV